MATRNVKGMIRKAETGRISDLDLQRAAGSNPRRRVQEVTDWAVGEVQKAAATPKKKRK